MSDTAAMLALNESLAIVAVSPAAASLLGMAAPRLLGLVCRAALECCVDSPGACPARQALAGAEAPPVSTRARKSGQRVLVTALPWLERDQAQRRTVLRLQPPHLSSDLFTGLTRRLLPLGEVEDSLQAVLNDLRWLFKSDLAALALYEHERREVRWQLAAGSLGPNVNDIRLRPAQGFAGRIVASRRPLQTSAFPTDLTRDPKSYPIFIREDLRSALGVPLQVSGEPVGVLMVGSRSARGFSDTDRLVLNAVADVMALAAENMRLYREASRRAATAERRLLAEEVHDGLSQHLFGLQLLLSDVQQSLSGGNPAEVQSGLQQVCRALDGSVTEVRRLIGRLRGEQVQQSGFVAGLCDYLEYFSRMSGLEVELSLQVPGERELDCPHAHDMLCIAQEALANAHRHGQARNVHVELARAEGQYRLQVRDDGRGFDPATPQAPGHFGLEIMRERARRTGSRLEVASAPGQGTTVTVWFSAAD